MVRRRLLTLPNMYPLLRVWFRKSSSMRLLLGRCCEQLGASGAAASLWLRWWWPAMDGGGWVW